VKKADLHIHTAASDGQLSARDAVKQAVSLNLSVISITDHDTIAGVRPAQEEAEGQNLDVMPGVEITTAFGERECHMLAYDFDMDDEPFNELLRAHQQARVLRAGWIIKQLGKKGMALDVDEVIAEARGRNVGRPHIAEVLRRKGYVATVREAFIRHLSDDALGTIQSNYRSYIEVINIVKKAGGVSVIAHPGRMYSEKELEKFVAAGIDGLECLHPGHNYEIQKRMEAFAEKHNLLTTGGSDYHGGVKDYYRNFGLVAINHQKVNKIRSLANRRKKVSA
jgi:predicted metal-dependent phosphoesterase TrpH